jgi:hypothetical protein
MKNADYHNPDNGFAVLRDKTTQASPFSRADL